MNDWLELVYSHFENVSVTIHTVHSFIFKNSLIHLFIHSFIIHPAATVLYMLSQLLWNKRQCSLALMQGFCHAVGETVLESVIWAGFEESGEWGWRPPYTPSLLRTIALCPCLTRVRIKSGWGKEQNSDDLGQDSAIYVKSGCCSRTCQSRRDSREGGLINLG